MNTTPTPFDRNEEDERERLLFRFLLLNKWFIIPTTVAYEWLLSISPYKQTVYYFLAPTLSYIAFSLVTVLLLWLGYRRLANEEHAPAAQQSVQWLTVASFGVDVLFVLYLTFLEQSGNLLWLLFIAPLAFALLVPRFSTSHYKMIDSSGASVVLIVIYGMLSGFEYLTGRPRFVPADLLLSLSGLFYLWVTVRLYSGWLESLNHALHQQTHWREMWSFVLKRFPAEFFVVNEQGEMLIASEAAHKLLTLPSGPGQEWPEASQAIRNALLLRFHAETSIEDTITIPDDQHPNELKIYPHYETFDGQRLCLALIQEQHPGQPRQGAVLRSDRLTIAGQIAAGLAHEIGNPLGVIRSCAGYLRQKAQHDSPYQEEFELIENETQRCQELIDRLLSLASPKRDTLADHDLRTILEQSLSLVKYQAGDRPIDLKTPAHPLVIHANEGQISAVFVNLFLNALQSMEDSPPEATLRIYARQRGDEAVVDVTDEGSGIPKAELEKIFDPFFTKKASGTGLGLSIVHQIITSLGGAIDVASHVEAGTTFTVHLPLKTKETTP